MLKQNEDVPLKEKRKRARRGGGGRGGGEELCCSMLRQMLESLLAVLCVYWIHLLKTATCQIIVKQKRLSKEVHFNTHDKYVQQSHA